MRSVAIIATTVLATGGGCTGELTVSAGIAELIITSPEPDRMYERAVIGEHGYRVAVVPLSIDAGTAIRELGYAINGGAEQARVSPGDFEAEVRRDGSVTITVTGYAADGQPVAEDSVVVWSQSPELDSCNDWLDLYGARYEVGPARDGVADPVTVATPIHGLARRYIDSEEPRNDVFMDCRLALALHEGAGVLRQRGVVEVADIGVYNYRCIGGGEPPDCPSGMSQHAYARAIDIAGYTTADGEFYSVNDDWIIDPDGEDTCAAPTENSKDSFLHEIICAQKAHGVWNTVLTPNYNAAHRNHFHVDLSDGSDFLELRDSSAAGAVDQGPIAH